MKKARLQNNKWFRIKNSTIILWLFITICFFCILLIHRFNQKVTPKLIEISTKNLNKLTYNLFNNYSILTQIDDEILNNILSIYKNKNDEIIHVNYNTKNAYYITNLLANRIKSDFNAIENGKIDLEYYDEELSKGLDGIILSLPIGIASDSIYLSNLGPRIPVKIKFVGMLLTNLKTKIQNYGINNALIEIYIDVAISHEIITPVTFKENELSYEILIAAEVINGTVPSIYGGMYETKSNILNVPIN